MPRVYAGVQTGMQIVELPGRTLMFFGRNIREIYTDGRQHPADHHLLWMGHSTGSWDGNTFVVDTVNINDANWIDRMGHPHSDKLHLIERFQRVDDKTMLLRHYARRSGCFHQALEHHAEDVPHEAKCASRGSRLRGHVFERSIRSSAASASDGVGHPSKRAGENSTIPEVQLNSSCNKSVFNM